MTSDAPRLLVALRDSDEVGRTIDELLPDLPWGYAARTPPAQWGSVEVLLVGSVERELGTFSVGSTPRLRFVQRVYTGLDQFPFERFPPPIQIAGNVGGYAPFVAEEAMALALAAARATVAAHAMVAQGRMRPAPPETTLRGRTALILGYGAIGREIAARLAGFGVRVVGLNRDGREAPGVVAMYPADHLDDALAEADLVFEARPLTQATRGTIGAAQLAKMRPNAIVVNIGRAATIDEEALYRHLKDHPTFRAGLDVWWDEDFGVGQVSRRFPWTELPNLTASPHAAAAVPEATVYALRLALANVQRFFRGETPRFLADRAEYPSGPTA
jgi:phosphoglycerate dehydrogenase-like enzyme